MMYSPMTANTFDKVCSLKSDNKTYGEDFWILTDGYMVTIAEQKIGEPPKASVSIPRHIFNRMVKWYTTPTKGRP